MNQSTTLKIVVVIIMLFTGIIVACNKSATLPATATVQHKPSQLASSLLEADATIVNTGPIAADGCGWLVKINSTNNEYSPVNLSSAYETDSLKVHIYYHLLTTNLSCGSLAGSPGVTQVQIDSIYKSPVTHSNTNALIFYTAPVAADGCDWLIKVDGVNEEFSPTNLSSEFLKDSLRVKLSYHLLTTKFACGQVAGNPGITQIAIDNISK